MTPEELSDSDAAMPNGGGPPHVAPTDPIAPTTHNVGGTYAEADYSPAAQRSYYNLDQYEARPPELQVKNPERRSGFVEAKPYQPVGGEGSGM